MESDPPAQDPLVCAECGAVSPPDAAGWRALLEDDDDQAVTFCPECAAREFGDEAVPVRRSAYVPLFRLGLRTALSAGVRRSPGAV
jgi:hypothetical protein